jgi:hypothetical protein
MTRFRSKDDLYSYLSQHSNPTFPAVTLFLGQYYLPPKKKLTKDFIKLVFAGKKHLVPLTQIRPAEIPKYDELSVVNLISDVMKQPELANSSPSRRPRQISLTGCTSLTS